MCVAPISSKQCLSICHDTSHKQSRRIFLSSHFGNKKTGIRKMNPLVVFFFLQTFTEHYYISVYAQVTVDTMVKETLSLSWRNASSGRDTRGWRSDKNAIW